MKKKIMFLFYIGLFLNLAGFAMRIVFAGWEHNWVPIPIFVLGSILLITFAVKSRQIKE